tara:strand:- start:125 stop:328 length:204 start_codon:yes stop_codon:yes gene_type:complete
MPIWLRKFTYQQIAEARKQESDAYKKSSKGSTPGKTNVDLANPNRSNLPDYAKSSKSSTFNTRTSKK